MALEYVKSWFRSSAEQLPVTGPAKDTEKSATRPKPCCVCKEEKSTRDECMLFSKATDPTSDCKATIESYRTCMEGFGFKV